MGDGVWRAVGLVPQQCTATSKTTGRRCGRIASPGPGPSGPVCTSHGAAAPQVRARAEAFMPWGQALRSVPRDVEDVAAAALHILDATMQHRLTLVAGQDPPSPEALADAEITASRVYKLINPRGAKEPVQSDSADIAKVSGLFVGLLIEVLDEVIKYIEFDSDEHREQWRGYLISVAASKAVGAPGPDLPPPVAHEPHVITDATADVIASAYGDPHVPARWRR